MSQSEFVTEQEDRYTRHRQIGWWDQGRLSDASVIVVGAGALGNEVIKNLSLLGVGQVTIIDFDQIAQSNLTRSVLFRDGDVGRSKAGVAAARARELNPDVRVTSIDGDLELDVGLGLLKSHDLALGCLDSVYARLLLNRYCRAVGVPWINGGISEGGGEVGFFSPRHKACYECGMTPEMWARIGERKSCTGLQRKQFAAHVPTTAPVASTIGAIQVQQAVAWIHDLPHVDRLSAGQKLVFHMRPYRFFVVELPCIEDCLVHSPMEPLIRVHGSVKSQTLRGLFQDLDQRGIHADSCRLSFDLATSLDCASCGRNQALLRPSSKITQDEITCHVCCAKRTLVETNCIERGSALAELTLQELWIPRWPILTFSHGDSETFLELFDGEENERNIRSQPGQLREAVDSRTNV